MPICDLEPEATIKQLHETLIIPKEQIQIVIDYLGYSFIEFEKLALSKVKLPNKVLETHILIDQITVYPLTDINDSLHHGSYKFLGIISKEYALKFLIDPYQTNIIKGPFRVRLTFDSKFNCWQAWAYLSFLGATHASPLLLDSICAETFNGQLYVSVTQSMCQLQTDPPQFGGFMTSIICRWTPEHTDPSLPEWSEFQVRRKRAFYEVLDRKYNEKLIRKYQRRCIIL